MSNSYSFLSYAKVNLFLEITGKNENNYHTLESIFSLCSLYDEIEIKLSKEKSSTVYNIQYEGDFAKYINNNSENILNKICNYFINNHSLKITNHINITVKKNIPVGAGLGGGSSNAATLIKAFNSIFKLNLNILQLQKIAYLFGADVPFFIKQDIALIKGVGEQIYQLKDILKNYNEVYKKLEGYEILIAYPNILLGTKNVFNKFNDSIKNNTTQYSKPISNLKLKNTKDLIKYIKVNKLSNSLKESAVALCPQITLILQTFLSYKSIKPIYLNITGSGSAVIAIYNNKIHANWAMEQLKDTFKNNNIYIKSAKLITRLTDIEQKEIT
jgi:4-diphosphocytidyl-2-C-methyl-D-erythritol kinase